MALGPGTRFGAYEILTLIGSGGMGDVYQARDARLERTVAIKVLPHDLTASRQARERFQLEARVIAGLQHPHICTIHDIGETVDHQQFIVMELLDGETLRQRLERGPILVDDVIDVAIQIADALDTAHRRGIIHRDLKPANLFMTRRGDTKILDFGLAKTVDVTVETVAALTRAGDVVGTIGYMAPEQARGEPVDARSDLFSLGVVLYELATGRTPFVGPTSAITFDSILNRQPAPPHEVNPDVPAPLERIIGRLMMKDASARYQSARELVVDLKRTGRDDPGPARVQKTVPSVAVLPFVNMSTDAENQFFCDGLAEELINALTRLPGLQVASRTSAFRFRDAGGDVQEIGRQLRVGAIVEGSVRRSGTRLRVTAQLIKVADGYHLWSDRYDREMADVFAIQDEIVTAIVRALAPALLGDARHAVHRPTDNIEAFELYLKGRHYWHQRIPGALQHAIACFEKVIALDPEYALAYTGLADCYSIFRVYGWHPLEFTQTRALEALTRALTLDPELLEAHYSQALYTFFFGPRWRDAETQLRRAIGINPRSSLCQAQLAIVLACDDRADESAAHADLARDLDPFSPLIHFNCGLAFNVLGRFDLAEHVARRALELQPDLLAGLWMLGFAFAGVGRYDEAIAAFERIVLLSRAPIFVGLLGEIYGLAGRFDDATRLLGELDDREARGEYVPPFVRLSIAVGRGDMTGIRAGLEACVKDRAPVLIIKVTCGPWLEPHCHDAEIDRLVTMLYDRTQP